MTNSTRYFIISAFNPIESNAYVGRDYIEFLAQNNHPEYAARRIEKPADLAPGIIVRLVVQPQYSEEKPTTTPNPFSVQKFIRAGNFYIPANERPVYPQNASFWTAIVPEEPTQYFMECDSVILTELEEFTDGLAHAGQSLAYNAVDLGLDPAFLHEPMLTNGDELAELINISRSLITFSSVHNSDMQDSQVEKFHILNAAVTPPFQNRP